MNNIELTQFQENFPFLTGIRYGQVDHVGIVQNHNNQITSLYDFNKIKSDEEKQLFLKLGDCWWWESNRIIPVNIFLPEEMEGFKYCMRHMITKDVEFLFGPVTSLHNIAKKRIKRRSIQLVRKVD